MIKYIMHRTVGNELNKYAGVGPGFDLLRIGLALLIFHLHTRWIAQSTDRKMVTQIITGTGEVIWQGWTPPRSVALLQMFFALSGFLVTGSAFRTRGVRTFLTFRFLRIFPALATEITLSALILGPFLTTKPLRQYFSDPHFWEYFGNIVGRIRFKLPGLFESNPVGGLVNLNLWTLAPEYDCYVLVTFAMLCSLFWAGLLHWIGARP
jgi:peptidoglycan/LPS O-acetylase OafA/YrhL